MNWLKCGFEILKLCKAKLLIFLIVCKTEVEIVPTLNTLCKCLPFIDSTSGAGNDVVQKGIGYL